MAKVLCLLALVAMAMARPSHVRVHVDVVHTEPSFEEFKSMFTKEYEAEDEDRRSVVYAHNVRYIETQNMNNNNYTLGVNQFADLTPSEFRKLYISKGFDRSDRPENIVTLSELEAGGSVDWRTKGAVTPVKNQGQCGSCWSFSTTGSTEGAWEIAGNTLTSLSEQQLMDCSTPEGDHGCQGGLMDYAFEYIHKNGGVDSEADYPYTARNGQCNSVKAAKHVASISGYADVPHNNENQLMAAVSKGPVSVAIEADQSAFQFYKSGVFHASCGTRLDHGVLAVGYGTDAGMDYWLVKNSWGATWGDQGYIMMKRGVGASGICGIAMQPSYPQVSSEPSGANDDGHYADPLDGPCTGGDEAVQITGVSGEFCSPSCSSSSPCPTALPDGATARPECILEKAGSPQPTNCAMVCKPSENDENGANAECPTKATCKAVSIIGICTYDS